ncbi:MAG: FAD-binding oxidoreductase [Rhizobiales bacterium]|nr:FAD-binding oxidoreductase [Hyphomicrobiales bacterium]
METEPKKASYDVVIVGGAMIGSSVAWHLSNNPDFNGSVLVVERDPTYEWSSTTHTNSCTRQQFSNEINVRISQYGVECIKNFRDYLGGDPDIPDIPLHSYGYMYLAGDEKLANILRENQKLQESLGAGTRIMTPDEIAAEYPFYNLDGIILGSHNPLNEGYFEGSSMFDWWRRKARQNGVEYLTNEVVAMTRSPNKVESVTLKSGEVIACGKVINASGPRAVLTARMAGLEVPVEPRRRHTFIFDCQEPLGQDLPLTIDPAGAHMRTDGEYYLAGCPPLEDPAADYDDFEIDHSHWEETVWPILANRVPAFEAVKLINTWVGHYAFNTLDQNAIIGPSSEVTNFIFVNGFSGHGFQQSPAMGRGVSELVTYEEFRTLDLSPLGYDRIERNEPFLEKAVI